MTNPNLLQASLADPWRTGLSLVAGALLASLAVALGAARRARRDRRDTEAAFQALVATVQEGVLIRDGEGEIVLANERAVEIVGLVLDPTTGRWAVAPDCRTIDEDGRTWPSEAWPFAVALREGTPQRDRTVGVRMPWGETVWVAADAVPLFRAGESRPYRVVTLLSDITVRKRREERTRRQVARIEDDKAELAQANARLADMALTDGLTGLRNRHAFAESLEAEIGRSRREGHPLSLIMLDVDEFKAYNDRFGHPAGDEALRTVGHVLTSVARGTDTVARYGGEEFAILLPEADERASLAIAERFRSAIERAPWPHRPVTASFGVATLRPDAEPEALVGDADAALYRSKETGRNRVAHVDDRDGDRFLVV